MGSFAPTAHWRDAARNPRFFFVDARSIFPVLLFLVHIRLWTALIALVVIIFLAIIEYYGFTVPVFFRVFKGFLAGPDRYSQPWWRK